MKFLLVASLVSSAAAFSPAASAKQSCTAAKAFANGMVGGEGPEPIPFSSQQSSVNWDPVGFTEVSRTANANSSSPTSKVRLLLFTSFTELTLLNGIRTTNYNYLSF